MKLAVRKIRLVSTTAAETFEADLGLSDGLNVIRAANSSGKSTLINAILYGLGMEGILGPGRQRPLKSSMYQVIADPTGVEHAVLESHVMLELENQEGRKLTVRRQALGGSVSSDVIRVWDGWALTESGGAPHDTYARIEGSATRELGFHTHLERFVGWDLPNVVSKDGRPTKLYMQLLFPFFFVEQNFGWSSVRGNLPHYFQVRDPERRAFEYLLSFDAGDRQRHEEELRAARERVVRQWAAHTAEWQSLMRGSAVELLNVPDRPVATWPLDPSPMIRAMVGDEWIDINAALGALRGRLADLRSAEVPTSDDAAAETELSLERLEERQRDISVALQTLRREIATDESEIGHIDSRLHDLEVDRERHRDARRIVDFGGLKLDPVHANCPTCLRRLPPDLIGVLDEAPAMTLEDNMAFIEQEQRALRAIRQQMAGRIAAEQERAAGLRRALSEIRSDIRAHRSALVADRGSPSARTVREILVTEERIERLEDMRLQLETLVQQLGGLSEEFRAIKAALAELEADPLSPLDHEKLATLRKSFRSQLDQYGFRSLGDVDISPESYLPERSGFNLTAAVSSSDTVRLIWAYLTGLFEVAERHATNHPRFLVLDEPGQQDVEDGSVEALLRRLARLSGQTIVAITRDVSWIRRDRLPAHVHEFGDEPILRPRR